MSGQTNDTADTLVAYVVSDHDKTMNRATPFSVIVDHTRDIPVEVFLEIRGVIVAVGMTEVEAESLRQALERSLKREKSPRRSGSLVMQIQQQHTLK